MSVRVHEFNILILGGSQGAKKLNETLPQCFDLINKEIDSKKLNIVHQTGQSSYESVLDFYSKSKINAEVYEFIDNIEEYYSKADLIVARSGAGTLAEICAVGRASILIPFPYATHNHQYHNAKALEEQGAALLIEEKELDVRKFSSAINELLDHDKLKDMADRAKKLGRPDAAKIIVDNIYEMLSLKPCMDA